MRALARFAALLPCIVGCVRQTSDEKQLRLAFSEMKAAALERDYAKVWELTDSASQEELARELRRLQEFDEGDPHLGLAWWMLRDQCGLSHEDVRGLDARQYFLAILNGLDRMQPEARRRQLDETRGRRIVSIRIWEGGTADMKTKAASGADKTLAWVKEGGAWKCKTNVPE